MYRAGIDPLSLMREYPNRIKSLHIRNSKDGVWMESFGEGDIDHIAMKQVLQDIGYNGWLIVELAYEQATKLTCSLPENSQLSREYVHFVHRRLRLTVKEIFGV